MRNSTDPVSFRQSLLQLLETDPAHEEKLLADLAAYGKKGHPLYSSTINILTHLSFSEAEAQRHWRRLSAHREELRTRLDRDVGLRVAMLDYFVNVNRELKNPKFIEISIYERTARSAVTDGLTGLFNHTHFLQALKREEQRAQRHHLQLSLVMIDLDDFKELNDTRGHLEGDRVLMKAATLIGDNLREIDMAARYGGEEFALLLPETSRTGAYVVADRIRVRIETHFRRRRSGPTVTVSGGVASYPEDATAVQDLIRRADEGLYRAKADGKNRITMFARERRRHHRVMVTQALTLRAGLRGPTAALARNVSPGGLLVLLRRPLPVGSPVTIAIRPPGGATATLKGEVVRVDRVEGPREQYQLGIRLIGEARGLRPLLKPHRSTATRPRATPP